MKNILLISPIGTDQEKSNFSAPALGTHRIASYLQKQGHFVTVYDPISSLESLDFYLSNEQNWDIIGLSMIHDSVSSDTAVLRGTYEAIYQARKNHPNAFIIAGGPEATENFYDVIAKTPVDAVCLGEGEDVILDLANGKHIEEIDGIIYRKYAKPMTSQRQWRYFDSLKWGEMGYEKHWDQTRNLYPEGQVDEDAIRTVRMVDTTHCVRSCIFCSVANLHAMACGQISKPVGLTAEQNYEILRRIKNEIPSTRSIYYCTDDVLWNTKEFLRFCDIYLEKPLGFRFLLQTHTSRVTRPIIEKLASIGTVHFTFGVENASEYVRKTIRKPQNSQQIENIIDWCFEFGVQPYYLIILFCPESRMEDLWINYETISRWIEKGTQVSCEPYLMPYRAAPIYSEDYEFEYQILQIGNTKKTIRQPIIVYPKDPTVREIFEKFRSQWPDYLESCMKREGHQHHFKGITGKFMIELLGKLLKEK